MHGGFAPQVRAAARRRVEQLRASAYISREGYPPLDDPLTALQDLGGEAWAMKDFFNAQIEELRYSGQTGEQMRAEVVLYTQAVDRCLKVGETLLRLGIAERVTRVKEAEAVLFGQALDRILDRLDLTPDQQARADAIVVEEIEAISSPDQAP
jgi:hypothetical protein